jgi:hypothetical protein
VGSEGPMRRREAEPMRKKTGQIAGDRLKPALSAANVTFVTDVGLSAETTVAQETFPGPFDGTPVTGAAIDSGPDSPGMRPTNQRGKPEETSKPRQGGALRRRDREVEWEQQKPTPSAADDTLLTEQQLAARWQVSCKTLRNARVAGRLLRFVKIGRIVRYRLSEVVAAEEQNSVRSTSGGAE